MALAGCFLSVMALAVWKTRLIFLRTVTKLYSHFLNRKKRLTEAVDFHQFLTDADDVDTWMLDILRLVSSDDIGKDESNVQTLLKKHKDITDELKNYASTIDALHEQVKHLVNSRDCSAIGVSGLCSEGSHCGYQKLVG